MKKITILLLSAVISLCLAGCCFSHEWVDATCTAPKTCAKCEKTEGTVNPHTWEDATCTSAKKCSVCNLTEGSALGHDWLDATCENAKTCSVCKATDGEALGHKEGAWEITSEPEDGEPGKKTRFCEVCDKPAETQDFFYPYFDMSFEEFVDLHNKTYSSNGWKIREVDTGFSYFMNNDETAIVFHEDRNKKSSGATAFSTKKLEEFDKLMVRFIDEGATSVDNEIMTTTIMIGGVITQPLADYELESFLQEFIDNWVIEQNTDNRKEGVAVIGGYEYIIRAYTTSIGGSFPSVYYEWICQTT